jgi:uncharacterized membrane protein SpoIIM required for sporulation
MVNENETNNLTNEDIYTELKKLEHRLNDQHKADKENKFNSSFSVAVTIFIAFEVPAITTYSGTPISLVLIVGGLIVGAFVGCLFYKPRTRK